jgi:hypothetical protein
MSERREYDVALTLKSPFMFQGLVNTRIGADVAFLRDENGNPVIPAAQFRGVLRAACSELIGETSPVMAELFGKKSLENTSDEPIRGAILLSDLTAPKADKDLLTTRIAIDDDSGSVKKGALQVIELAKPFGATATFRGKVILRCRDSLKQAKIDDLLGNAVKLIPAIGAFKSVGFGEVIPGESNIKPSVQRQLGLANAFEETRIIADVAFDRPILVNTQRIADNVFEGSSIVPGAALKGALAEELKEQMAQDPQLAEALSALHISHAFPVFTLQDKPANLPIPMSLITYDDGQSFEDVLTGGGVGHAPKPRPALAKYVFSGKEKLQTAFRKSPNSSAPLLPEVYHDKLPRTHIAIDNASQTAEESQLYSTISRSAAGKTWRVTVDATRVDQKYSHKLIGTLLRGLDGVGRGDATATFSNVGKAGIPVVEQDTAFFSLTLVTPAIMFDPLEKDFSIAQRYANYWREHFHGAELKNFLARRRMAGGYLGIRRRLYGDGTYYPFILTEPGSVFRVEVKTAAARQAVETALRFGLPIPHMSNTTGPVTWKNCPFVPGNGYGQIIHNLIPHDELGKNVTFVEGVDVL